MHRGKINAIAWIATGVPIIALGVTGLANGKYDHDVYAFRDWLMPASWTILTAVGYLNNASTGHWKPSRRNANSLVFLWVLWCLHILAVGYTFYLHIEMEIELSDAMRATKLIMALVASMGTIAFWAIDHKNAPEPVVT